MFFKWKIYYNSDAVKMLYDSGLKWRDIQPQLLKLSEVVARESTYKADYVDGMAFTSHKGRPLRWLDAPTRTRSGEGGANLIDYIAAEYRE